MTPDEYLGRVRELLPALRERAPRAEQLRRLPDETFADFQQAGLFRALQPKRHGGFELDPGVFYRAVAEVAAVCGSTGWVLGVLGVHNWHLAIMPPQAQQDVWGEDDGVQLSTALAPTGKVERADGGFRLSGRWSFSSGCDFCHWAVLGGIAPPNARESLGPPDARVFLVPRRDYRIEDNWHVVGLCGTGSKDIVVEDAFVPEYRTHSYLDAFHLRHPGCEIHDAPLYRLPFALVFRYGITAPAIGAAQGALQAFREQTARRVNVMDQSRAAEDPFMQHRLAESAARARSGARSHPRSLRRDDAAGARRAGDPAGAAGSLSLGRGQGDRMEHRGGRPPVRGERRPRSLFSEPDPAGLARRPRDARPCRQQSGCIGAGFCTFRTRPAA
jgi:3-hydroxy-9,10-secoandrosta-1,3,5(10)-triene-9,17-dione monooxygenase